MFWKKPHSFCPISSLILLKVLFIKILIISLVMLLIFQWNLQCKFLASLVMEEFSNVFLLSVYYLFFFYMNVTFLDFMHSVESTYFLFCLFFLWSFHACLMCLHSIVFLCLLSFLFMVNILYYVPFLVIIYSHFFFIWRI